MMVPQDAFETLRGTDDHQLRGYRFEQTVREILPWSFRPAIAVSAKSEQFDAFFEFNGWHFLVECKAKRGAITPGSHDWEDFELKVSRRGGSCIGLFCSLDPLDPPIYEAADQLNRRHLTTIIIAGSQWDEAISQGLALGDLVRFLVILARSKQTTRAPSISEIITRLDDTESVEKRIRGVLRQASVTFLRRHRSPRHEQIYVPRILDREVAGMVVPLEPSRLSVRKRTAQRGDLEFEHARRAPSQIAIVRDLSGAGKTTFSVQLAEEEGKKYFCIARAALEPSIDGLDQHLNSIGPDFGIAQLIQTNRPIIYVVDSLDEGLTYPQKRTEFRALLKVIEELNEKARAYNLLCFPLLLVVTVREEYWREWESQLEGSGAHQLTKRFSRFTEAELEQALESYQRAYHFSFDGEPRKDLLEALAHPFTMQVYAEANEYMGPVDVSQHMGFRVLSLFFERKKEDISKRPIAGFSGETMMRICAAAAADMLHRNSAEISEDRLGEIIRGRELLLASQWNEIVRSLRSEQIFAAGESEPSLLRFRHGRFLEYLLAFHIQQRLRSGEQSGFINVLHEQIAGTSFASPYVVLDNLKALTAASPAEAAQVQEIFSGSRPFMTGLLQQIRAKIAQGEQLRQEDAKAVKLAIADRDPTLCWHGFFALAAAGSMQKREAVLEAFCLAWDANSEREDSWKLIQKLRRHDLLDEEETLRRVVKHRKVRTWFVYLDEISASAPEKFARTWREFDGATEEKLIEQFHDDDWRRILEILSYLKRGEPYPIGML